MPQFLLPPEPAATALTPSRQDVVPLVSTQRLAPALSAPTVPELWQEGPLLSQQLRDRWVGRPVSQAIRTPQPSAPEVVPLRLAQAITPAADGVGTTVNSQGNRIDIGGGTRSRDGANLFQSLRQFGLSEGQIANFLSSPEIRNILTRVVGGEASVINGTIQVSGGQANLFLLNPAGIVFGPSARLNVPAAFTATTANAIGFGDQWLNSVGTNAYAQLVGNPTQFKFSVPQPGAIVNMGRLAVQPGQALNLIGGTVLNTGQVTAPGGEVTIAAVPGTSRVQIRPTGSLLSLEVDPAHAAGGAIVPLSLPELLTGGQFSQASGIAVNQTGQVVLAGTPVSPQPGTTIVSGRLDVSGNQGGTVQVVGDRVGLIGAQVDASGLIGGGSIRIGGDCHGQGALPTARLTYVSPNSSLQANATQAGNGGRVIVWSNQRTDFFGTIAARGGHSASANGGFVEVSGKQALVYRGMTDVSAPGTIGTILLDPTDIQIVAGTGASQDAALPNVPFSTAPATFTISQTALQSQTGAITLEATRNITIASGVSLDLSAGSGDVTFRADADGNGVGAFVMDPSQSIVAQGRNLAISGTDLTIGNLETSVIANGTSIGGNITLAARNTITAGTINSSVTATPPGATLTTRAGNVTLSANGTIQTGAITASAANTLLSGTATGGNVRLTSATGNVQFDAIVTNALGATLNTGGTVALVAPYGTIRGTAPGTTIFTGTPVGGSVTIQHGGGVTNAPFVIGNATVNGTAGAINAGTPIGSGTFLMQPNGSTTTLGLTPNTVTIEAVNQPPTVTANQSLTGATQNQPFSFTGRILAPSVSDRNFDNTTLVIAAVNQGSLSVNGLPVVPGVTTVSASDTLQYTPPPNASGLLATAFTIAARDGVAVSNPLAIGINIAATPTTSSPPETPQQINQQITQPLLPIVEQPRALSTTTLTCSSTDAGVYTLEDKFTREYEEYLDKRVGNARTRLLEACDSLALVEAQTGVKPAVVYISFVPSSAEPWTPDSARRDSDMLELIAVLPNHKPIYKRVPGITRAEVLRVAREYTRAIVDPTTRETDRFLAPARQLYQWLIQPLDAELQAQKVKNLVFIPDAGLRSLPIAALNDGNQFLVEKYSLGTMPSLSVTDTRYRDLKNSQVLAMGASVFSDQKPLPAVPVELAMIQQRGWAGETWLNQRFTLDTLQSRHQQQPFGILHLATHAEFVPGSSSNSYIQLWETKLRLNQIPQLGWNAPPIQLLVLSACRTALGDEQAELGFAGLAYQTGVRSVLASLWAVDDEGTLALMSEFYRQLKTSAIRAEALRQAQLAMLRRQIRLEQGALVTPSGHLPLPPELAQLDGKDLSYPFYWAAFTMVGNPW